MRTVVTTQAELDAALAVQTSEYHEIIVNSPAGVWLTVSESGSATVVASGSATVRAYGSATVVASGSATVEAYDSATVEAYDSATVVASDSATVRAYGSATVRAGTHVAVHLHSKRVTLTGGIVIDVTDLDLNDPATWLGYHGVTVTDGKATVYKAVDTELNAGQGWTLTNYAVGSTVTATDWRPTRECGHGLHFGYTPESARRYFQGRGTPRYLACEVDVSDLVALDDKCKAPSCRVVAEVDSFGREVAQPAAVTA